MTGRILIVDDVPAAPPALPVAPAPQRVATSLSWHERYLIALKAFHTEKPEGRAASRRRRQMERDMRKLEARAWDEDPFLGLVSE